MHKLLEDVKNNILEYNLIQDKDKIIVGVSGGPDSMFLLHVLYTLQSVLKKENIEYLIEVAHINHKIRKEAICDQNLARKYAESLGLTFHVLEFDVESEAKRLKIGTEECGRNVRYEFFKEVMKTSNATKIAVAHNAGDNAETIMLNFLRGAGITGLSGMEYKSSNIIRPILNIAKEDILKYLDEANIPYAIDKTNLENIYTRNKVRNDLLVKIKNEYNPNIIKALNRMAKINRQDEEIINEAVDNKYSKLNLNEEEGKIILNTLKFNEYTEAMRFRLVRKIIERLLGNTKDIEMIHIKDTCNLIKSNITGKQYILGNKYKVVITKKNIATFTKNM